MTTFILSIMLIFFMAVGVWFALGNDDER